MKGNVVMLYPIFITMSAFLSVTWANGATMPHWQTEYTTMQTDADVYGTDGGTAEITVSAVSQETTEQDNTRNATSPETGGPTETTEQDNTRSATSPETGGPTETTEQDNTRSATSPETGGPTISCYVCSASNITNEDEECYVKQGRNQSAMMADCDKSCVITHYQHEDSKAHINITRSCDQCEDKHGEWSCMSSQDIQMCTFCCDTDGCNHHMGNGATILKQTNFILTVSATFTGVYLAA